MKLRQAKKILCRKKNYFWRPRIMAYSYGFGERPQNRKGYPKGSSLSEERR